MSSISNASLYKLGATSSTVVPRSLLSSLAMAAALAFKVVTNRALLLVLCLLVLQGVSDCVSDHGYFYEKAAQSRKMLQADVNGKNEVVKGSLHGSTSSAGKGENFVRWELRTVPSGPDPLHHHGGSPNKPRTDP